MKISWSTTGVSSSFTPLYFIMFPNQHSTVFEKSFLIYYKNQFWKYFIFRREKKVVLLNVDMTWGYVATFVMHFIIVLLILNHMYR